VDDEHDVVRLMQEILSPAYDVVTALGGAEALATLRALEQQERLPDLAILDIKMPGIDGLQLAEQVRERWGIPIVFVSAVDDPGVRAATITRYAEDFVTKPFDTLEFLARIHRIVQRLYPAESRPEVKLTPRQRQVLDLIAAGATDNRISLELGISAQTVSNHVQAIRHKLGAHSRPHAVALAAQLGLIEANNGSPWVGNGG
jgi:DNA-binding NarL/FixJ family response regulator